MNGIAKWIVFGYAILAITGCSVQIPEDEAKVIAQQRVVALVKNLNDQDRGDISLIQSQEVVGDGWFFVYRVDSLPDS